MKRDELGAVLERMIERAGDAGPGPDQQKAALDYYYGRPRGDEVAGQPKLVSTDLADMVHAIQSQLLPAFCGDQVCSFEPDGPQDDEQARMESDATNRVMMESSRGYIVFTEAVKNALLLKNGIVKVYLDEQEQSSTIRYGTLDPQQRAAVLQDNDEVEEKDGKLTVRRKTTTRLIRIKSVAPENFRVDADHDSVLLDEARLVAEKKRYTRAELLDMGIPRAKVERINYSTNADENDSLRYRDGVRPPVDTSTWAGETVDVWEVYARLDTGDSGKVELRRYFLGGQEILLDEPADFIPYAAGTGFIEPHKFWGLSLYDRLKTVQDAKTFITRQALANLANANLNRTLANDAVNHEDLMSGRINGIVRVRGSGPVSDSAVPFPYFDTGASSIQLLGYFDQVRADRGGAALQMASGEMQTTAHAIGSQGVDRIYSVQEQLAGMIARTLAETLLRSTFLLVHRLLREEWGEPLTLRLADQWVQTDPRGWRPRDRINIKQGLSPGEKARKAQALMGVIQLQTQALQLGADGVLVDLKGLYSSALDWATAAEIDSPQKYFVDPSGEQAQQTAAQKGQQAQASQAQEQQLLQIQIQMEQGRMQLEQLKLQLDKLKTDQELAFKYREMALNAEIEEAKLTASVTADLAAAQQSARDEGDQRDRQAA